MTSFHINRLAIIGVGLIGGSLARSLRQQGVVDHIVGYGRTISSLEKAVKLGVIDEFKTDTAEAVADADVIVLATPLGTFEAILKEIQPVIKADAIITDVGSAKGSVVDAAKSALNNISNFIPGHPVAGTEKSGVDASFAELFEAHRVILTPTEETDPSSLEFIKTMWESTGADVVMMGVEQHDQVLAATSHLPHMLAYALVDCLASMDDSDEIFCNAAGGFADFTRIASSSPEMWHDICYSNRKGLLTVLNKFDEHIDQIRQAIQNEDSKTLLGIFNRAKQGRDNFMDQRKNRKKVDE